MTHPLPTRIDICLCTFRRTFVSQTLASLAALDGTGLQIRIIVADNDEVPSARESVEAAAIHSPYPITYIHAPARNISIARNACLDHAQAEYVAFIDDDELAAPGWLQSLLKTARRDDADAVFGPVRAIYDSNAPSWMQQGDFHSTAPVFVDGVIKTGYTCNALVHRFGVWKTLRFRTELGRSGGEDTDYFHRVFAMGGRLSYAPDAIVTEPVPSERAQFSWLARRRLRSGQTHGYWLARSHQGGLVAMSIAGAKALTCMAMAALNAGSPWRWRRQVLRALLHCGVVTGLAGMKHTQIYGADTQPQPR